MPPPALWIAGVALALSSLPARAAAPPEPLAEPKTGQTTDPDVTTEVLRVEVAPAIDDAALLPTWIVDRHSGLARALRGPEGRPAQWIAVRIDGITYDYRVSVIAMRGGEPVGPVAEPTRCECTTEELLELVDAGIEAARDRLSAHPPSEAAGEPAPVSEPAPELDRAEALAAAPAGEPAPRERSTEPSMRDAPSHRLGRLGGAGIGLGVVGAGLTTAGALLAMRPEEIRGEPGNAEVRDLRGTGVGLATSGGIVLVTGVAMLVVDLVVPRERSLALVPLLRPRMAGVSLVRRF